MKTSELEKNQFLLLETSQKILESGISISSKVQGISMLPLLWPNEIVLIEPINNYKIQIGDILLIKKDHRFIAHRLLKKNKTQHKEMLITKGDSNFKEDEPTDLESIYGLIKAVQIKNGEFVEIKIRKPFLNLILNRLPFISTLIFKVIGKIYLKFGR